jgi:hypothetical protein
MLSIFMVCLIVELACVERRKEATTILKIVAGEFHDQVDDVKTRGSPNP